MKHVFLQACGNTASIPCSARPFHLKHPLPIPVFHRNPCRWRACIKHAFKSWTCREMLEPFSPMHELLHPKQWWLRLAPGWGDLPARQDGGAAQPSVTD